MLPNKLITLGENFNENKSFLNDKLRNKKSSGITSNSYFKVNRRLFSTIVEKHSHNYVLYKKVQNILSGNYINNDTQYKIEKLIIDNNILRFRKDNLEIFEVIGRLNKDLKEELFNSSNELNSLIINFKKRKIFELYKKQKLKKKDIGLFYLSTILEVVSIDYVVSILLGKTLMVMNTSNQEDRNTAKVFIDLGSYLINYYFYELYKGDIQKLNNETNNSKYNMWDWRRENKELIDKFDIILTHGIGALLID